MCARDNRGFVLFCIAAVAAALALWTLSDILLLVFASALIGVGLAGAAEFVSDKLRIGARFALALVVASILALVAAASWFFGGLIAAELAQAAETAPRGLERLRSWAAQIPWLQRLIDEAAGVDLLALARGIGPRTLGFAATLLGAIAGFFVALVGAVYFAAGWREYRDGALKLSPESVRPQVANFLRRAKLRLRRWFIGQLGLMTAVGTMAGVGLWIVGVPSAAALGLFAGLVNFIPFFGPFIAGAVAMLVALAVAPELALWTLLLFVAIQQVENQILEPLSLRRSASLPAAVTIFSVLALAVLFGALGAVLAAPLTVLIAVAVEVFWLGEREDGQGA